MSDCPEIADERAEKLISTLNQPKHRAIQDLATTPLMLNLICLVFRDTEDLPTLRSQLYEYGINILLEDWDRHRDVHRDVLPYELKKVHILELLLRVARETFEQSYFLFEKRQTEWLICEYLKTLNLAQETSVQMQENSKLLLRAIEANHGLIVERSSGIFSFSHLTFHEYFTARAICSDQLWEKLLRGLQGNKAPINTAQL